MRITTILVTTAITGATLVLSTGPATAPSLADDLECLASITT